MRVGTLVGLLLIVGGLVLLVFDQVSISREREVARVGPLEVTTKERETFTVPTLVSGVMVAAGIALVIAVRRAK
jgi:hypothetical protein